MQLATWNGELTSATAPWSPVIVPPTDNGSQLVGLSAKFGRLRSTWIIRVRSGMPSTICGSGSETAVTRSVAGSTLTAALTTTLPRS